MAGKWPHSPMTTIDSWRHGNINGSLLQGPPPFRQPGLPSYPLGNGTFPSVTQTQGLNRLSDNIAPDTPGPAGLPDNPLTWAQPLFDQGEQPPKNENPREGVNRNTFQLFPTQRIVRIIQPPGGRKPQPPGGGGGVGAADTYMVMVTGNDSMPGYLLSKITSDDNSVTIAETGDGGGEAVDLAVADDQDEKVALDAGDAAGYLLNKIVDGTHTTVGDNGADLQIDHETAGYGSSYSVTAAGAEINFDALGHIESTTNGAAKGLPTGSTTYDLPYWDNTANIYDLLAYTSTNYQVLQRNGSGNLAWDWVRAHG